MKMVFKAVGDGKNEWYVLVGDQRIATISLQTVYKNLITGETIIGDQENKDFRDFMNSLEKDFREKYPGVLGEETQGLGQ